MTVETKTMPAAIEKLGQIAQGYFASSALSAITRLGVADVLKDQTLSIDELATKTSSNADALCRVLRLLCSLGIFEEVSSGKFANNDASTLMREDVQGSQKDMLLFLPNPLHFKAYTDMLPIIRDGQTAAHHVWGKGIFEVFAEDAAEQKMFDNAMTSFTRNGLQGILGAYDFSDIKKLVDVAGGHGLLLTGIMQKYPDMHGVLFDLPHVTPGATARIKELNLQDRCEVISGDFFQSVPGGDAIIMKHIIHDWDDERSTTILKNCHKAGVKKVLLAEMLLSGTSEPEVAKFMDIEMLMLPGGRERTETEFAKLFDAAGYSLKRVVRTQGPIVVLEATAK